MNWLSLPELTLIHERVIDETGGVHGVTNPGGLESAGIFDRNGGRKAKEREEKPRRGTF
jgi:hypothetical protein